MKLHRLTAQLVVGAMLTLPVWVQAAGLGKLTVKSALGQPLSAEIELLVADKAELDSLNASLATSQAYKDAQIEFAPVLSTLQFSIDKRADGRPVLRLTTSKPVNDPFMDMLIELNWASGRLLREYTVLLDPPGIAVPQTVSPVAVSVPETRPAETRLRQPAAAKPAATGAAVAGEVATTAADKSAAERGRAAAPAAPTRVKVKSGDTLSGIASRVRPASVSLEQVLVSLYRENPSAFAGNNMNRLKAGQTLTVPNAEAMASIDLQSARREISLQADDWRAYRAKLAEGVAEQPAAQEQAPAKTVVGKITPKVEDKAQPAPEAAKDVLKLSKAAPAPVAQPAQSAAEKAAQEKALAEQKARAEEEDRLAREKALKESSERAAALEKQIQDMQKLAELKQKEAAAAAAAPAPAAAAPKVKKPVPPVVVEPESNWYDELLENPLYWVGGVSVVGLGGLLWWMLAGGRLRRRQATETAGDSIITGGELQSSGMAGAAATGGVVNTGDTSFLTDFSQAGLAEIDTHDVDPIAEADVYMAYGRDAQAEEILREALTKTPERHEIRLKLLEIYAARKNVTAFENVAGELYAALGGQTGAIWERAVEMGRSIDPHNPLYGGSGATAHAAPPLAEPQPAPEPEPRQAAVEAEAVAPKPEAEPVLAEAEPQPMVAEAAPAAAAVAKAEPAMDAPMEFDLDLPESAPAAAPAEPEPPRLDLDLEFPTLEEAAQAEPAAAAGRNNKGEQSLDFDLSGFDLNLPEQPAAEAPKAPAMDFSGLDLDLSDVGSSEEDEFDEVATKLDLARAYLEMGDKEGAREILQEVINEGNDRQKSDARSIMAGL